MEKLLIFPYNGNGLEAVDCVKEQYEIVGFIDDAKEKQGVQENGLEVFSREYIHKYREAKILAVPGSPSTYLKRQTIIGSLHIPEGRLAIAIHPTATVSPLANIGYNVLIMAGVVITSNAVIDNHICILPNTVVHHDVKIGDYSLIGSNITIAGFVKIGKNCYIGSGSRLIHHIEIGDYTIVGMGSNVLKSVPGKKKAVGNPARIIGEMS